MKRNNKMVVRLTESDMYSIVEDAVRQQLREDLETEKLDWQNVKDKAKWGLGGLALGGAMYASSIDDGSYENDRPDQMERLSDEGYNDSYDKLDDYDADTTYDMTKDYNTDDEGNYYGESVRKRNPNLSESYLHKVITESIKNIMRK